MGRPWYGFLYRLLGAHGAFWAFVVAVAGVWLSYEPAILWLANREPEPIAVEQVFEDPGYRHWVVLEGLEIDLVPGLFGGAAGGAAPDGIGPGQRVMAPAYGATARAWRGLFREVDAVEAGIATGAQSPGDAFKRLKALREEAERVASGYVPDAAVAVLPPSDATALAPIEPVASGISATAAATLVGGGGEGWLDRVVADGVRDHLAHFARLRRHVRPQRSYVGWLERLPHGVGEEVRASHGIRLAPLALRTGRGSSRAAAAIFVASVIILTFLVLGFFGLSRSDRADKQLR